MPDWTSSMVQSFEYYIVNPSTWKDEKQITNIKTCTINRDVGVETLGSATFDITESVGECYIRSYLITVQNGVTEKIPLGTHLVQTPSSKFDGKVRTVSMDAYTPLIELKEKQPPIGYYIPDKERTESGEEREVNVMDMAYRLARENMRAPVVKAECPTNNVSSFASDTSDTWLSFLSDFISSQLYTREDRKPVIARYRFDLDEIG